MILTSFLHFIYLYLYPLNFHSSFHIFQLCSLVSIPSLSPTESLTLLSYTVLHIAFNFVMHVSSLIDECTFQLQILLIKSIMLRHSFAIFWHSASYTHTNACAFVFELRLSCSEETCSHHVWFMPVYFLNIHSCHY